MDDYREQDFGVREKPVILVAKTHPQCLVLVPFLVVVALLPQNADTDQVLFQLKRTSQVRSGEEPKSTTVDLQRLVNRKLHGEVCDRLFKLFIECVGKELAQVEHVRNYVDRKRGQSSKLPFNERKCGN